MQKVSYMGDGSTTEFTFNFPYFENTNIVVTKNNTTATGYNIVGTSAAPDADIPYTGGKVVFETAPTSLDSITIARNLPLTRVVDYQPTAKLEPTTLNQDANYLMEVIKDRKDELDTLISQYHDIADKESTTTLLARISAIHDEIVEIDTKITALGDISTLRENVTTNTGNITTLSGDVGALKNASNFSTTGKAAIVNMIMPGSHYENLTLQTSGSRYTMPADGYIYIRKATDAVGQYIDMSVFINNQYMYSTINSSSVAGHPCTCFLPVPAGAEVEVSYNASAQLDQFRFIYANNI